MRVPIMQSTLHFMYLWFFEFAQAPFLPAHKASERLILSDLELATFRKDLNACQHRLPSGTLLENLYFLTHQLLPECNEEKT